MPPEDEEVRSPWVGRGPATTPSDTALLAEHGACTRKRFGLDQPEDLQSNTEGVFTVADDATAPDAPDVVGFDPPPVYPPTYFLTRRNDGSRSGDPQDMRPGGTWKKPRATSTSKSRKV